MSSAAASHSLALTLTPPILSVCLGKVGVWAFHSWLYCSSSTSHGVGRHWIRIDSQRKGRHEHLVLYAASSCHWTIILVLASFTEEPECQQMLL